MLNRSYAPGAYRLNNSTRTVSSESDLYRVLTDIWSNVFVGTIIVNCMIPLTKTCILINTHDITIKGVGAGGFYNATAIEFPIFTFRTTLQDDAHRYIVDDLIFNFEGSTQFSSIFFTEDGTGNDDVVHLSSSNIRTSEFGAILGGLDNSASNFRHVYLENYTLFNTDGTYDVVDGYLDSINNCVFTNIGSTESGANLTIDGLRISDCIFTGITMQVSQSPAGSNVFISSTNMADSGAVNSGQVIIRPEESVLSGTITQLPFGTNSNSVIYHGSSKISWVEDLAYTSSSFLTVKPVLVHTPPVGSSSTSKYTLTIEKDSTGECNSYVFVANIKETTVTLVNTIFSSEEFSDLSITVGLGVGGVGILITPSVGSRLYNIMGSAEILARGY